MEKLHISMQSRKDEYLHRIVTHSIFFPSANSFFILFFHRDCIIRESINYSEMQCNIVPIVTMQCTYKSLSMIRNYIDDGYMR